MKIILTQDVESLGIEGDIVDVKNGYARNYLIPYNYAIIANASNLKTWENEKIARERKIAKNTEKAQRQAEILAAEKYEIKVKCGEEGKMYGSVTPQDIASLILNQTKIEIDRKKIVIPEHIKSVGEYQVFVKIYKDVKAEIKLSVVKHEEEK